MTRNFTDKEKEYLRIASRFLKEVGLYDLWIQYLYTPNSHCSWRDKECENITDILGWTLFTHFVKEHKRRIKLGDWCMFEIFGEYVKKMHPEYDGTFPYFSRNRLDIDTENKKVEWK